MSAEDTTVSDLVCQLDISLVAHLLPSFQVVAAVVRFLILFVLSSLYPPFFLAMAFQCTFISWYLFLCVIVHCKSV